jgi:hypothetical protein
MSREELKQPEKPVGYIPTAKEQSFYKKEVFQEEDPFLFDGHLPVWVKATAVDKDGYMYMYSHIPKIFGDQWNFEEGSEGRAEPILIGLEEVPNWKESLRVSGEDF